MPGFYRWHDSPFHGGLKATMLVEVDREEVQYLLDLTVGDGSNTEWQSLLEMFETHDDVLGDGPIIDLLAVDTKYHRKIS